MSDPRRGVLVLLLLAPPVLTGCLSFALGTTAAQSPGAGRLGTVGPRFEAQVHSSSEGIAVGLEHVVAFPTTERTCCAPWRTSALFGYSLVPLLERGRVGFEGQVRLGGGRAPYLDGLRDTPLAFIPGVRVALPIRLSPTRPPWKSDGYVTNFWAVVPELNNNWFVASGLPPTTELGGALSLRLQLWSGVLP